MHALLQRQLRRTLDVASDSEIEKLLAAATSAPNGPEAMRVIGALPAFIERVGLSYAQHEQALALRDRSLELSSAELTAANEQLRSEAEAQAIALEALRQATNGMLTASGRPALDAGHSGLGKLCEHLVKLIAERSAIQLELEEQKRALDHHAIVSITDLHGNILYANRKFCQISEYTEEELLGQNHRIVNSGQHPPALFRDMWETILAGQVWHGEICNRKKYGEHYWVSATIVPITGPEGKPRQYIAIRTDITAIKHMEAELKETLVKAEKANQVKGEFLATMSHEIRTPMNGIIGMTSLLLDTALTQDQKHFADTIRISAESLLGIINDILDFSRLEAGRVEIEEAEFELRPLVEGVVDIVTPRLRGSEVELSYILATESRGTFRSDPGRLRQVLLNLVGNAVKFTEKGSISLEVEIRPLSEGRERVEFRVTDTGIGIRDEAKARLFSSFTQADSSTVRRFGGSGLGLAICKRLIEALGGEIGFNSLEGKGSSFWFAVPLLRSGMPPVEDTQESVVIGAKILVVDDNPVNREIFCRQLTNWGAKVIPADSASAGLMALRYAQETGDPYQLVLLDHLMPELSGLDFATMVRVDPDLCDLKLVMATSADVSALRAQAQQGLVDQVLSKPVRQSALFNCIVDLMGGSIAKPTEIKPKVMVALPPIPNLRILVAEDNAINRQVAVGLLAKLGYRADIADNGQEAIDLHRLAPYDLVFMDINMPRLDGCHATQRIRALPSPASQAIVVAMTANAMNGDRERCLAAGMDDYVSKPVDSQRLSDALERWRPRLLERFREDHREARSVQSEPKVPSNLTIDDEPPLVSLRAQEGLRAVLGDETFYGLMQSFRDGLACKRAEFSRLTADAAGTSSLAHALQGEAGNLGFPRLARAARDLELAAKAGKAYADNLAHLERTASETGPFIQAAR